MDHWTKNAVSVLFSSVLVSGLVACGGSSEEGDSVAIAPTPADSPTPTTSPTPTPDQAPAPTTSPSPAPTPAPVGEPSRELKTTDLVVPEGTDFTHATAYEVMVKVDKSDVSEGKASISICSDFEVVNSVQIRANYDDCQVRATFEGGVFEKTVLLDHTDHELAVSVIFLEAGQTPYVKMFNGLSPDNNLVVVD